MSLKHLRMFRKGLLSMKKKESKEGWFKTKTFLNIPKYFMRNPKKKNYNTIVE